MRIACPECGSNIKITHGPREYSEETREHYGGCEQCNQRFKVLISVMPVRQTVSEKRAAPIKSNELSLPL